MTRRRRIFWVAAVLVVAALLVPTAAVAAPDSTSVQGPNSALSWTDVRDSYGVPLSDYMFVSSDPSILNPLATILVFVLQLLFVVWLVIVTLAIWLIGYAGSFAFLDVFRDALLGAANLFAGQVATTIVLITAVTVGAFFVSYFVVRGFYAKATMQVVTMVAVAVFGVSFLAHPLAEVLGPDGLLAKGRDLGGSIGAGLHGDSNPDPARVVATMRASLADNFVRKPLQVWNFGHVIDDQCGSAWSSAMMSGDSDHAKSVLNACDPAAYAVAEEPSFTQVAAGLVVFICGLILLSFAVRLGLKVIRAAANAVYHGFMSILGFAAGGYVYGPTQTFLIRNLVDTAVMAFAMVANTVIMAIYVLVLGDVFRQARGQVITVLVLGAIVMVIAHGQIDNFKASLASGGAWVANRFALATQGHPEPVREYALGMGAARGIGAGPGAAPGIGVPGAAAAGGGLKLLAGAAALNTLASFGSNPLLRMAGMNPKWLRGSAAAWQINWQENLAHTREYFDAMVESLLSRRGGWKRTGDEVTGRMLAGLADDWFDNGYPVGSLGASALNVAGIQPAEVDYAVFAKGLIEKNRTHDAVPIAARAWTGVYNLNNRLEGRESHDQNPKIISATFEAAGVAIRNFTRNAGQPRLLPLTAQEDADLQHIRDNWDSPRALDIATDRDFWNRLGPNARHTLAREMAAPLPGLHKAARAANLSPESLDKLTDAVRRVHIVHDVAKGKDARNLFQ